MKLFQVDSFTKEIFRGNPAGVLILDKPVPETWMLKVAAEMNLSETVFVSKEGEDFRLRWFTPEVEVALCGHATLAAAHILWEQGIAKSSEPLRFQSLSGILQASKKGELIELDFPQLPPSPRALVEGTVEALGLVSQPLYSGKNKGAMWLIEIESEEELRGLKPDFARLASRDTGEYILTTRSRSEFDFISRFFGPSIGINEDPVTGSAHCALGPYWAEKLSKTSLRAYQASTRGGELSLRIERDRTHIGGHAVTVFQTNINFGM